VAKLSGFSFSPQDTLCQRPHIERIGKLAWIIRVSAAAGAVTAIIVGSIARTVG